MRRWHRWAAIPAGLFLFFVALTGVLLHLDMMRLGQHPPGHGPQVSEQVQALPSDADLAEMVARLADAARRDPALKVKVLRIDLSGPRVTLVADPGGPPGTPGIRLDAVTGKRIAHPSPAAGYHYVLQDLHAGYALGWPGRILSVLCGISLMVLAATGLQVWWDMRRRRRKAGFYWN